MTGQILDFSPRTRSGVILGDDGQRYGFVDLDWIDSVNPIRGMGVDFEVRGDNAVSIYRALRDSGGFFSSAALSDEKNRTVAGILAVLVGWVGVHKFYLGMRGPAKIQAIAGVTAIVFSIILPRLFRWYEIVFIMPRGIDSISRPYISWWLVSFGVETLGYMLWLALGIIGLVEGVKYLTNSDEEFAETYLSQKKPWF